MPILVYLSSMGSIARSAIFGGKVVPLFMGSGPVSLDEFTSKSLGRFGFAKIGQKVANHEVLSVDEIDQLLNFGGPAVLMKLVELNRANQAAAAKSSPKIGATIVLQARDFVSTNRLTEFCLLTTEYLTSLAHREIYVFVDGLHWTEPNPRLFQTLSEIANCRSGVRLVAPALEDLVSELILQQRADRLGVDRSITKILARLKDCGVSRLRMASRSSSLKLVEAAGFAREIRTNISDFPGTRELSQELYALRILSDSGQQIDTWSPASSYRQNPLQAANSYDHSAINFTLLRTLAIGSICLPQVPSIRASSAEFSLEAICIAKRFGATDFGFGALNQDAERTLRIRHFDSVIEAAAKTNL